MTLRHDHESPQDGSATVVLEYKPERRPLTLRERWWAKSIADGLAARHVSPNALSMFGLAGGVLAGCSFVLTQVEGWRTVGFLLAALMMLARGFGNIFDGMVAVQTERASPLGELYNEIPDRISDPAIMIGAGYAWSGCPILGFLAACGALFTAYVRVQGKAAGARQHFCGPMAKTHRMLVLSVTALLCAIIPEAWQSITLLERDFGVMAMALAVICVGCVITAIRRIQRIAADLKSHASRVG